MKSKVIGLIILIAVIAIAAIYAFVSASQVATTTLSGYIGGEKIGFIEDPDVQSILDERYHLKLDYSRAGSIDMINANDLPDRDFLFPSSQTALELYTQAHGEPVKSQIVFNTPIVLYSHKPVVDALINQGVAACNNGVYTVDMAKLVALLQAGTDWSDIGLPELYGPVTVGTTSPADSNSGNMFAGLIANVLNGGKVVDETTISQILPDLRQIFTQLGYMETSSSDLFDQFLKTGIGAKPLIAGYENQLLEFAKANPDSWNQIKDDIIMLYPTPTVWSSHVYIALDDAGAAAIDALMDPDIQAIAWESHGFRTGIAGTALDTSGFPVDGIQSNITSTMPMPNAEIMELIITALE